MYHFSMKLSIIREFDKYKKVTNTDVDDFCRTVPTGIEPAISCVTGRHVNRYTTGPYH